MFQKTFQAVGLAIVFSLLTADEPSVLQPVEEVQASNVTDTTLQLQWTLSADMVTYLRHFEVCLVEATTGSGDCYLTAAYTLSWGGGEPLLPCTDYNVSVTWRSVAMRLSQPALVYVTTLPQSVTEMAAEEVGPTLFTASWSLPSESSSCVSVYQVYLCQEEDCVLRGTDVPQSTTSFTFDTLQPCLDYSVVVTSQTWEGALSHNASLDVQTATQDPGPVRTLEVTQSGESSVLATWTPPSQKSCVAAYSVCGLQLVPDTAAAICTEVNGQNSATLAGLTPCSVLNVSVTTVAADGHLFQAATSRVDIGVPSSVTQLTVASETTVSVDVQWSLPADNAKCAKGYSVCQRESLSESQLACSTVNQLEYNITGLQTATSYDIYVAAIGNDGSSPKYSIVRAATL